MSKSKRCRLEIPINTMSPILPHDIIYLITEYLPIRDLCTLDRTCRSFHSFFLHFFSQRKGLNQDFLVTKWWSPLKKYAAIASRTRIFPEMRCFYDLTHLLVHCLKEKDMLHYNFFWQEVVKKEGKDLFNKPISYLLLIEQALQSNVGTDFVEGLFSRLHYCPEDFIQFIHRLVSVLSGYHRLNTLTNILDKYVPYEYREDLLLTQRTRPQDPTLKHLYLKEIDDKYQPFVKAIVENDNTTLINLLTRREGYDENFLEAYATAAAICGRKDLYVYLRSYLGYTPFYNQTHYVLVELGCHEMIEWISKNSYPWSKP